MDLETFGNLAVDRAQELQELFGEINFSSVVFTSTYR